MLLMMMGRGRRGGRPWARLRGGTGSPGRAAGRSCRLPVVRRGPVSQSGLVHGQLSASAAVHRWARDARGARLSTRRRHPFMASRRQRKRLARWCLACEVRKLRRSMLLRCWSTRVRVSVGRSWKEAILKYYCGWVPRADQTEWSGLWLCLPVEVGMDCGMRLPGTTSLGGHVVRKG